MPNRVTSESQQASAGGSKQTANLLRMVLVVGLPVLSVILRAPIWFTLLLLLVVAVFLFFRPQHSQKHDVDPKKAWTVLMASYARLRNAYDVLQRSPSNAKARQQFLTSEQTCLSLLNSRSDSDWGPDSEYAAKVRIEIAELSVAARARCADLGLPPGKGVRIPAKAGKQGTTSGDKAAAVQPAPAAPTAKSEVPPTAKEQGSTPASATTVLQASTPAAPVRPEDPTPAVAFDLTPAKVVAAVQPVTPAAPAEPEVLPAAKRQGSTPASVTTASQRGAPAAPVRPAATAPAEKEVAVAVSAAAAVTTNVPVPPAKSEVPPAAEEQGLMPADVMTVLQPSTPMATVRPEAPASAENEVAVAVSVAAAVTTDVPVPPAKFEVPPAAREQGSTPASVTTVLQPSAPTAPARPEVPTPAEREIAVTASAAAAVQPATPVAPAKSEVLPAAREQGSTPASESVAVKPEGSSPSTTFDISGPAVRRLTPFLWLSGSVEDAAAFYVSVFKNSRVVGISRYPEGSHAKSWSVMSATVCLDGQDLMLLNGGLVYKPPETFQLQVRCADQAEVDYYWERLLADGGEEKEGGWLRDRFGVSWQVIPDALMKLLTDPQRVAGVTEAMLKMRKMDIARLHEAVGQTQAA